MKQQSCKYYVQNLLYLVVITLGLTNELLESPGVAGKNPVTMVMVTNLQKGYQDNGEVTITLLPWLPDRLKGDIYVIWNLACYIPFWWIVFCLGNVTNWFDVTPSKPMPHPLSPPPILLHAI